MSKSPFSHILAIKSADIHCPAVDLALFRRPYFDLVTGMKTDPAQVSVFDPLTRLGGTYQCQHQQFLTPMPGTVSTCMD